jgi:hypothetical protein
MAKQDQSNSQSLDRVRAKSHYNFHKRLRDAEEDRKLQERLNAGDFNFDESPLVNSDEVEEAAKARAESKKESK